ncbi:MAG: type II toxin-antitoxin system HicB family antitoxin [Limosilactobacillus pontis]|uniref:Toxin-antitoxin system HicB family antitoxin n=1 Tax=Limosilactobacillus pontis TaxID=35787 RepID=A0A2J6NPV3_9LACO|nr:type II toxin-antitoxin system HicB family antitoxin [Limosilactobacillus pontis]PMB83348.1 toxin-antitoxin system HicB family antitoxin [Limosilactobacillus pontis]
MKQQLLKYKGYHGTVEFSLEDNVLYGNVIDVNSLISYEGKDLAELRSDFEGAVDDYLAMCEAHHESPEKAYTGSFNVRLEPEMHKRLALYARNHNESLNTSVKQAVAQLLAE